MRCHIELPMLALSEKLFAKMVNDGMGELGTQGNLSDSMSAD